MDAEQKARDRLKKQPLSITDLDHSRAQKNWNELERLREVNYGADTSLHIQSIWRGNMVPPGDHTGSYRRETEYHIPIPFTLRRDDYHGELWIKVTSSKKSRPGLGEPWGDASTEYMNDSWVLVYHMNIGLGRDEERSILISSDNSH
mmetsp:Transcript_31452/g.38230  ORF Transcript_31452/g.38230 Transcript_31452/m.38230 type:complete len:147 (+) Transcript_31452:140-580(+)